MSVRIKHKITITISVGVNMQSVLKRKQTSWNLLLHVQFIFSSIFI